MVLSKRTAALFLFTAILLGSSSKCLSQQIKYTLTNGFGADIFIGFPSGAYGWDDDLNDEISYNFLFGLQLGNRWYIKPADKYGIGLMVNWIELSYTQKNLESGSGSKEQRGTLEGSLLKLGPLGTYSPSPEIAFDAYYNIRPGGMVSLFIIDDFSFGARGVGFTHALGCAFHYKELSVGVEYSFGKIKDAGLIDSDDNYASTHGTIDLTQNNFRIMIGVRL